MKIFKHLGLVLLVSTMSNVALADTKGLEIATEMDKRDTGFKDMQANLIMILRNKNGDEAKRRIRNKTLEVPGDGDKSLAIFDHPADVKGTAFLSYTHAKKADDQWLYLPALKRTKRISSANKSGPFLGSEFAYEDISSQELDKYSYQYINEEKAEGRDSYVIERKPTYKNSGYTKQIVWVDKEYYQPNRIDFYDRKGALLKTLTFHEYKRYLGKHWRSGRMEMLNHQTGKSTSLLWQNYQFKVGLNNRDFHRNILKRIK